MTSEHQRLAEAAVSCIREASRISDRLTETHASVVADLSVMITQAFLKGNKVLLCGNGGSASDSQHIAAEFVGRFRRERIPLPAIALTANGPTMTAIANDYGYPEVFSRQVRALGKRGDVFIGFTTSGQSPNVISAATTAKLLGLKTVSLTGNKTTPLSDICDIHLSVPSDNTARVQEAHILLCHTACELVDDLLCVDTETQKVSATKLPKVTTLADLVKVRSRWQKLGLKVVWTNGCFDLLHVGHLRNLRAAKALGDILVVGVNSDDSVRLLKGVLRPVVEDSDRAEMVSAVDCVDHVVIFNDSDPASAISLLKPDIHTKGLEYRNADRAMPERDVVLGYGGSVEYLPLVSGYSTTSLIERIQSLPAEVR